MRYYTCMVDPRSVGSKRTVMHEGEGYDGESQPWQETRVCVAERFVVHSYLCFWCARNAIYTHKPATAGVYSGHRNCTDNAHEADLKRT